MIPKKIHYIWLGRNKKDKASQICINSWHSMLPDYEIVEWNEDNLPLDEIAQKNHFFKACRDRNLWAFMSDYLRLLILYKEGGIYLDTDVQVIKPFNDLLVYPMFIGYETGDYIGTGIIGSESQNKVLEGLLDFYNDKIWKVDYFNNPIIFRNFLKEWPDLSKDCMILPRNFFSPYDFNENHVHSAVEDESTYTIHWYNSNWGMSRRGYVFLQTKQYRGLQKMIEIIRKNIGYGLRKSGLKKWK